MQDRYSTNVMSQGPIVNFIVWRRSVLLMFFSASLGAFIFFLIGDVWTTFGHMRDMQQFATWNASYSQWKNQTTTGLQEIHCQEIDIHFESVLKSYARTHVVHAHSCAEMKGNGMKCEDQVDRVIIGCWKPGFLPGGNLCQEAISDHCPYACNLAKCRDTRNATLDYTSFSIHFARAMLYKLMEQFTRGELFKLALSGIAKFVTVILTFGACLCWADWPRSRLMLFFAWFVTFSAPFIRSVVFTPTFIDWDDIESELNMYVNTTDHHFGLSTNMQRVFNMTGLTCDSNDLEQKVHKTWEDIHHQVNYWCEHLQSVSGWCPWSDVLHKCARQCQFLTNYMGIGDVSTKEARKQNEKLCGMINDTDTKVSLDTEQCERGVRCGLDQELCFHGIRSLQWSAFISPTAACCTLRGTRAVKSCVTDQGCGATIVPARSIHCAHALDVYAHGVGMWCVRCPGHR